MADAEYESEEVRRAAELAMVQPLDPDFILMCIIALIGDIVGIILSIADFFDLFTISVIVKVIINLIFMIPINIWLYWRMGQIATAKRNAEDKEAAREAEEQAEKQAAMQSEERLATQVGGEGAEEAGLAAKKATEEAGEQAAGQAGRVAERQAVSQTEKQAGRQAEKQAVKQMEKIGEKTFLRSLGSYIGSTVPIISFIPFWSITVWSTLRAR